MIANDRFVKYFQVLTITTRLPARFRAAVPLPTSRPPVLPPSGLPVHRLSRRWYHQSEQE